MVGSVLGACALPKPAKVVADPDRIAIVVSERGPTGARLVAVDEHGDRLFALIAAPAAITRETHPAISPDGRWIVFASSRDRAMDETSLWIAPLAPDATPRRLTEATSLDSHPTWTPDGEAIVFASTRARGNFDLWRVPIDARGTPGPPVQLTDGENHEISPSVAADGTIVFAEVDAQQAISHLVVRSPDGAIAQLTEGPQDSAPALSPDGATVMFARPVVHATGPDAELWRMSLRGGDPVRVVDLPLTDETSPVWSPDGRLVFATSVLRGETGAPVFSSVIHVDLTEPRPVARILEDRAGAIPRLTPALTRTPLDVTALHKDPEYLPELGRIVEAAIARQNQPEPPEAKPK